MNSQDNVNREQNRENPHPSETHQSDEKVIIPVIEERFRVDKETVESGKVIISKKVHESVETIDIPVTNEQVHVDRVEINQYVDTAPPAVRQEGETTIIPILKEELVVQKKLLLVEEIRITRKQVRTTTSRQDTLRKEEVVVSRRSNDTPAENKPGS